MAAIAPVEIDRSPLEIVPLSREDLGSERYAGEVTPDGRGIAADERRRGAP